jgi:hypothetical protein
MTDAKPIRDDSEFSDTDRPSDLELAMAAAWDPEELGTVSIDESIADTLDAHESMDASLSGSSVAQERPAAPDAGSIDHAPEPLPGAILSDPGTIPCGWESIDAGPESIPEPLPDPLQIDFPGADPLPVKSSRQVAIDCGKSLQRLASKATTETERRDLLRKARVFYLDAGLVGMAAWCARHIGS